MILPTALSGAKCPARQGLGHGPQRATSRSLLCCPSEISVRHANSVVIIRAHELGQFAFLLGRQPRTGLHGGLRRLFELRRWRMKEIYAQQGGGSGRPRRQEGVQQLGQGRNVPATFHRLSVRSSEALTIQLSPSLSQAASALTSPSCPSWTRRSLASAPSPSSSE